MMKVKKKKRIIDKCISEEINVNTKLPQCHGQKKEKKNYK